jgi:hypothetical protein
LSFSPFASNLQQGGAYAWTSLISAMAEYSHGTMRAVRRSVSLLLNQLHITAYYVLSEFFRRSILIHIRIYRGVVHFVIIR